MTFAQEQLATLFSGSPSEEELKRGFLASLQDGELRGRALRFFDSPIEFCRYLVSTDENPSSDDYAISSRLVQGHEPSFDAVLEDRIREQCVPIYRAIDFAVRRSLQDIPFVSLVSAVYAGRSYLWASKAISVLFHKNVGEHLLQFAKLLLLISGYWVGDTEVLLVKKPEKIYFDEVGRLHNATGRAVQYADGWGFYSWHGVVVPKEFIVGSSVSDLYYMWFYTRDLEWRRIIQEILGPQEFIRTGKGRCINESGFGKLFEVSLGAIDPEMFARYVQVRDSSTDRMYWLRVPPFIATAKEAVAWTFNVSVKDYQPVQQS